jgi:hypothetical protein
MLMPVLKYGVKLNIANNKASRYEDLCHILFFRPTSSEANEKYNTGTKIAETSKRYCHIKAAWAVLDHVTPNNPKLQRPMKNENRNHSRFIFNVLSPE